MAKQKHIATFPLYGSFPVSGGVNTRNRVGTGYVYSVDEILDLEPQYLRKGHPFRLRWRNDKCRDEALDELQRRAAGEGE